MKLLTLILFVTFSQLCFAETQETSISYSAAFKLKVDTRTLEDATIFKSDDISIKLANDGLLSGRIITKEVEGLPADFDLHNYPSYLFGLVSKDLLSLELRDKFSKSNSELQTSFPGQTAKRVDLGSHEIYSLCHLDSCLNFIVAKSTSDEILMLSTESIHKDQLINMIKGNSHVKSN